MGGWKVQVKNTSQYLNLKKALFLSHCFHRNCGDDDAHLSADDSDSVIVRPENNPRFSFCTCCSSHVRAPSWTSSHSSVPRQTCSPSTCCQTPPPFTPGSQLWALQRVGPKRVFSDTNTKSLNDRLSHFLSCCNNQGRNSADTCASQMERTS